MSPLMKRPVRRRVLRRGRSKFAWTKVQQDGGYHDPDKYSLDGSVRNLREYQRFAFVLSVSPRGTTSPDHHDGACDDGALLLRSAP
jgi:hypothetical protein